MNEFVRISPFLVIPLFLVGCVTQKQPSTPTVIIPAISARPATQPIPPSPGSQPSLPIAVPSPNQGIPVYIPPRIKETELAGYVDERGRLFGPQRVYEVVEEGRFNVEAMSNPDLAYIPTPNLEVPPGMGSPFTIPAMQRAAAESPRLPIDLVDPRDITVTGLLAREDNREQATRMAQVASKRAVFDEDLGWILVPPSVVK